MPRHYRRYRRNDGLSGTLLIVGFLAAAAAYNKLSSRTISIIIVGCVALTGLVIVLALLVRYLRSFHERRKLQALRTPITKLPK